MIEIVRKVVICAPRQACFDLSRDIDDHVESMVDTGERIVGGKTSGLLDIGDETTFEARHFGVRFRLTSRIIESEPPSRFVDQMQSGPFKSLWHEHRFDKVEGGTQITDTMRVALPYGPLGWIGERLAVSRALGRVLEKRHAHMKAKAEGEVSREG